MTLDGYPVFLDTVPWDDAQGSLIEQGLSDGHLQVPPTERRLATMLDGIADPDASHGMVPPLFGDLTARAVAYNCVLAGCDPASLPVVLAAVKACIAPEFNLLGLLTTTGSPAIATIVHGPIASALGMNAGTNCLGPGNRANATIGRAISLVMRNVGGARETVGDMATLGQPGKLGFCFAEGPSGFLPPLPVRRGFPEATDAVTVLGLSGTVEALPLDERTTPEAILVPIAAAMFATGAAASAGRARVAGEQFFLLPPELAESLARRDWRLDRIQEFLFALDRADIPEAGSFNRLGPIAAASTDIHPIVAGGPGIKMGYLPLWSGGTVSQTVLIEV